MVRQAAVQALEGLGWQPENDTERVLLAMARDHWEAVVKLGTAAVAPLVAALGDEVHWVRQAAAEALGQVGDEHAVMPLVMLATTDEDCAKTAIEALQRLLQHSASRLVSEDLQTIAQLEQVVQWQYFVDECRNHERWKREVLDCSYVKQLARQELIRRGLQA